VKKKEVEVKVRVWIEDIPYGSEVVALQKAGGTELFLYAEREK
jgi:hypothetical protein